VSLLVGMLIWVLKEYLNLNIIVLLFVCYKSGLEICFANVIINVKEITTQLTPFLTLDVYLASGQNGAALEALEVTNSAYQLEIRGRRFQNNNGLMSRSPSQEIRNEVTTIPGPLQYSAT
jgi:hypothetical protein